MTKWMMIFALATVAAASTAACTSDDAEPDVRCERVDVEGEEYCLYTQPITETGYDCPQDLANPIEFEGSTVCSSGDDIPDAHRDPVRDELERLGNPGDPDLNNQPNNSTAPGHPKSNPAVSDLCTYPEVYSGREITVSGDDIERAAATTLIGCASSCCGNGVFVLFSYHCPDGTEIGLQAASNANFDPARGVEAYPSTYGGTYEDMTIGFGCVGQECAEQCAPAHSEQITSITGTFRVAGDGESFGSVVETEYSMIIEVSDASVTEPERFSSASYGADKEGDCFEVFGARSHDPPRWTDLGVVPVGASSTATISFYNFGCQGMPEVTEVIDAGWVADDGSFTQAPTAFEITETPPIGESIEGADWSDLVVEFAPTSPGISHGTMRMYTSGGYYDALVLAEGFEQGTPVEPVRGNCVDAPSLVEFDPTPVGSTVTETIALDRTCDPNFFTEHVVLTGATLDSASSPFSIESSVENVTFERTSASGPTAASPPVEVEVSFAPTSTGVHETTLTVSINDDVGDYTITLRGEGQ